MPQQLWTPADISKALAYIGASQPHLNTRVKAGMVEPVLRGTGQGSKNRYNAHGVILYGLATKIERTGANIEDAYGLANEILDFHFAKCVQDGAASPYVVSFSGPLGNGRTVLPSGELPSPFNPEHYIKMQPLPGITIWAAKDFMTQVASTIGHPEFMSFLGAAHMVQDCIARLGVNKEEIAALERRSDQIMRQEAKPIAEEREKLMEQYSQLTALAIIIEDKKAREDIQQAADEIKRKLKL